MSRKLIWITTPILILVAVYFLGPRPDAPKWNPDMPKVPLTADALEAYVAAKESRHHVKPNNEAHIVWNDSAKTKTEYSVVYLHGFSASQMEGDPVHRRFAKEFGCNLYLARMADHGIDTTNALMNFTADRWWASAKEALAIGKQLGDKVIIMSTSTGGTMALALAAQYPDDVYALINLSPNVALRDGSAFILNDPWGLQIARMVIGSDYRESPPDGDDVLYWNKKYRIESLVQLEEMVESKMTKKTFEKIKQPCLTLYYYKDEEHQDPQVSVEAILKMMDELSTPDLLKRAVAMPEAGAHVLGSSLVSKDVEGGVQPDRRFCYTRFDSPKNQQVMVSIAAVRKIAMAFANVEELAHFEKASFRVNKKIFATLAEGEHRLSVKLSVLDQSLFTTFDKSIMYAVPNKWGKQGWTYIELKKAHKETVADALTAAYEHLITKPTARKG